MELIPLGSTEQNALVGSNTYCGPFEVYSRRAYPQDDDDPKAHMRIGSAIEPFLIEMALKELDEDWLFILGLDLELQGKWAWKPGHSQFTNITKDGVTCPLRSTPDGRIVASSRHQKPLMLIESKFVMYSDRDLWQYPLNAQQPHPDTLRESIIPPMYYDQCQSHMMGQPDVEVVLLPVLFNYTSTPAVYWVKRDNKRIAEIQRACWSFWANCILTATEPPADATEAMAQYLARKEAVNEMYAPATDDDFRLIKAFYKAKDAELAATTELNLIANQLKKRVTDTGGWGLAFGDSRLHFKPNKNGKRTFSTKGLKRDQLDY